MLRLCSRFPEFQRISPNKESETATFGFSERTLLFLKKKIIFGLKVFKFPFIAGAIDI